MSFHLHDLSCLRQVENMPGYLVEPLEMVCGYEPYPELNEATVKDLGVNSLIGAWIDRNVEFSTDGKSFRRRPESRETLEGDT
jgi:hypothetical protein